VEWALTAFLLTLIFIYLSFYYKKIKRTPKIKITSFAQGGQSSF